MLLLAIASDSCMYLSAKEENLSSIGRACKS